MSRPPRISLTILGLGLAAVLLLLVVERVRIRVVDRDVRAVQAMADLETRLAIAHLWTEEFLAGDEVPLEEIHDGLELAEATVASLLGGTPSLYGLLSPPLDPVTDPQQLASLQELVRHLSALREVTGERLRAHQAGARVGAGTALDIEHDRVFAAALGSTRRLRNAFEARKLSGEAQAGRRMVLLLVGWIALVVGAAGALWRREEQRLRVERALSESQRQLLQSQKMDAVGRVAGGLAHDISNYLAAIRGQCELVLMRHDTEPAVTRKMEAAVRTVEKAAGLLRRLLVFGRRQQMKPEVVNLNRVILGLDKVLRSTLGEAVEIRHELGPALWNVRADPGQLEQVLVNLVVNAHDAMPRGGSVTLRTGNLPRNGWERPRDEVELVVADTGCGIPAELLDRIFEPFVSTKEGHNSGLGLAVVYGIVQQHEGAVQVNSEVGRGTAFSIRLPRSEAPETVTEVRPATDLGQLRGSGSVLVVDDNEEFREATAALLAGLGYRVTCAASGEEALARVSTVELRPDLVIADVVMPGVGGRELVEQLRKLWPMAALLTSGYGARALQRHGGASAEDIPLLGKLFSAEELARTVRDVLAEWRNRAEASRGRQVPEGD